MTVDSEAVLVGFAAALYSTVGADELATVEDTERFLAAYCRARHQAPGPAANRTTYDTYRHRVRGRSGVAVT